jgi:cyclase
MREIALALGLLAVDVRVTPQRPPQFEMEIKTTRLADNLYVLEGAGGNVAAFVWDEGVLLVDDKLAPASPKVKAAIAAITPRPIRFVVNSHWHRDHSGGNEGLAVDGSVIVAHDNVRRRMSVDSFVAVFDRTIPASPPKALPVVTFTRDVTFHLGGEEISVVHVDAAHTDGDSFVHFRRANVLHLGDCYLNGSFPVVDNSSGGTFTGTIAAADTALGMSDTKTRILPGHGPVASDRDLRQWRDMLATILERVKTLVAGGKTLEQVKAERPAKEWDGRFPASFVTSDHVVEEAYRAATSRK